MGSKPTCDNHYDMVTELIDGDPRSNVLSQAIGSEFTYDNHYHIAIFATPTALN